MAKSLNRVWIHGVFSTKYRLPLITTAIEERVHRMIKQELEDLGCKVREINGVEDHVHILFLLHASVAQSNAFKMSKGAVSHKINQSLMTNCRFAFQKGYGAFSVSENRVPVVQKYIQRQKEHHENETYETEYIRFLKLNQQKLSDHDSGWEFIPKDVQELIRQGINPLK